MGILPPLREWIPRKPVQPLPVTPPAAQSVAA
jgi:hypothetical protein